jgi:flagellar M-ring protein FliF
MATGTQLEKRAPAMPGQPRLADRFAGLWGRGRVRWAEMQPAQRGWALVASGLLVALIGGLFWYGLRTDWRTLYADMDPEDARQAGQVLAQAQIPFEPTANGAGIRVPAAQLERRVW